MLVMAACVVPPLDVTRWRSTSGGSFDCAASWAAPVKVAIARARPCSLDKPISLAACCIASRKKKT